MERFRPTTPGRRHGLRTSRSGLHRGSGFRKLIGPAGRISARNNKGRITVRRRGGGHSRRYRIIDFARTRDGIEAKVVRLEYDPNRSAHIALLSYKDGRKSYVIAAEGVKPGMVLQEGPDAPVKPGNVLPLSKIPSGTVISCIEMRPGGGAQMVRSAGCSAQLVSRDRNEVLVRMSNGEVRRFSGEIRAMIGAVSNPARKLLKLGKAGRTRWLGRRPRVRGVAMNPIDHPHGGGEGKSSGGRHPVTPWGMITRGKITGRKRRNPSIVTPRRRSQKRK